MAPVTLVCGSHVVHICFVQVTSVWNIVSDSRNHYCFTAGSNNLIQAAELEKTQSVFSFGLDFVLSATHYNCIPEQRFTAQARVSN